MPSTMSNSTARSSESDPREPERTPIDADDPKNGKANPSHDTHKSPEESPRGLGDGELMEQPDSIAEAHEPGPK